MSNIQVQVQGQSGVYTVTYSEKTHAWYCSCPAWRYQHGDPAHRVCKHIRQLATSLGQHVHAAA